MHIPDGFVSAPVAVTTWTLAAGSIAAALRAERRDPARASAGLLGALAAFVFAAQMINVPVAPGTSGHLVGATLLAVLVGPWRAVIVMAAVLAIQAVLFQDGGLTAFGANLLDMGVAGAFAGYATVVLVGRAVRGPRGIAAGAVLGAFVSTVSAAALTALWLGLSGLYPLRGILPVMLLSHSAIGLLEAALTGAVLVTVLRWRPDLAAAGGGAAVARRPGAMAVGLLAVALAAAAFLAPLASSLPDGLEGAALDLGFATRQRPLVAAPLEASPLLAALGSLAPIAAAVIGTVVAAALAWAAARSLAKVGDVAHR
jgi:cobalt/nickel transport system permease protein